ncbi:uncharacterized protein LOC117611007 isoform X1 [Osmia lignaria lignaria]|uniref:uncharacterized protein LOC117611007 isoform X1 n=1 Tax=Osmia lignaria lignaria TaxID=1437193 RepID=UPI00402B063B
MGTAQTVSNVISPQDSLLALSGDLTEADKENSDPSLNTGSQVQVPIPAVSHTQTEDNLTLNQPPKLDEEVLRVLGTSVKTQEEKMKLHPDLTALLVDWTTTDRSKELKETLLPKYPQSY